MTAGLSVAARNARLDAISTAVGAGGKLALYDGTRPATGGAVTVKLAEWTMGTPFAPAAAAAVLSPTLPSNTTGLAAAGAGTPATWARLTKADGTFVADLSCTVTGGGGDVQLVGTANIVNGQAIAMSSFTITEGNP